MAAGIARIDTGFVRERTSLQVEIADSKCITMRIRHRLTLRATRLGRFFEWRYSWTGSGIEKPVQMVSGADEFGHYYHKIHGPIIAIEQSRIAVVDLGRDYEQGETVEIELKQTLLDLDRAMRPFLGHDVYEGCKQVQLRLICPKGMNLRVRRVRAPRDNPTTTSGSSDCPGVDLPEGKYGDSTLYEWLVESPTPGFNYRLEWEYLDGLE